MKGKRIATCNEIVKLANAGKSVWHERWHRPSSAAWLANMPVRLIVGWIRLGWLYRYEKKK